MLRAGYATVWILCGVVFGDVACAVEPVFPLGKETTYVTGPLDAEGYVDYAGALNAHYRRGVTPENNANVLLMQAFGPAVVDEAIRATYFAELGVPVPPDDGEYFVDLKTYLADAPYEVRTAIINEDVRDAQRRAWTAADSPQLTAWLAANEAPLTLIERATQRTEYYDPIVCKPTAVGVEPLAFVAASKNSIAFDVGEALSVRIMFRLSQQQYDGAWRDLLTCFRLGRLTARGPLLMAYLTGASIDARAARYIELFVAQAPQEMLQRCAADLDALPPFPDYSEKIDLAERFNLLDLIQQARRHGTQGLDPETAGGAESFARTVSDALIMSSDFAPGMRRVNRMFDCVVAATRMNDRAAREREFRAFDDEMRRLSKRDGLFGVVTRLNLVFGLPEVRGNAMVDLLLPTMTTLKLILSNTALPDQRADLARVAFALNRYRQDVGRYPETLERLTPKYLARVPDDRLGDGPLKYRPTDDGFVLYSVGLDADDDAGRWGDVDHYEWDDIAIRMPPQVPLNN